MMLAPRLVDHHRLDHGLHAAPRACALAPQPGARRSGARGRHHGLYEEARHAKGGGARRMHLRMRMRSCVLKADEVHMHIAFTGF